MKELRVMLLANDMQQTIDFYTNVLGFELTATLEDPPEWCSLTNGGATLMFVWAPPHDHAPGEEHDHPEPTLTGVLYLHPDDVTKLHDAVEPKWSICEPLGEREWGMREFAVLDPNGYRVRFGEPL